MTLTKIPLAMIDDEIAGAGGPFINPENYGLKALGVSGADPALNKAALEAALAAGPVLLPPKAYEITGLSLSGKAVLVGCGPASELIVTGSGAGIYVAIPGANVGSVFKDFSIIPKTPGVGAYAIHLEQTHPDGFMANWEISGVYSMLPWTSITVYIDNAIASGDGFFTGTIEKCRFTTSPGGGIVGLFIGDSIIIRKNVISGGTGVAIYLKQVDGARQVVIEDNNLTARGGQIYLETCGQVIVNRNWCEHPFYMGEFTGAPSIISQITLADCYMCDVSFCTINCMSGVTGPGGVIINGSSHAVHLRGTTQLSVVGPRNWITGAGVSFINDASTSGTNQVISSGALANVLV